MIHIRKGTVTSFLGSRRFFYGVLIFFVFEAVWIAFSARYPMAFDEDFHMGIIKVYSHQWLPFLSGQPDDANQYGALARDPSYLYHYLMSFPYRLTAAVTSSEMAQVIVLRLINVAFVAVALVLFRRLLRKVGMSLAYAHTALALFVLIPIFPLLAGQVNYDNLMLPLTAWVCLLACEIYVALRQQKVPVTTVCLLALACMAGSLIKYPFLPIAAAAVLWVLIGAFQGFWRRGGKALPAAIIASSRAISRRTAWILAVVFIVITGLFVQRYGVNVAVYHTPIPACDIVLDEDACSAYGPWLRNYQLAQAKTDDIDPSPLAYTWHWLEALHYRSFFMVNGPYDSFRNYPPVPLPSATAILIFVSGLVAIVLYFRRIFIHRPLIVYMASIVLLYIAILWGVQDYPQFLETGQPVAINGRYLIPVLIPLAAVLGQAFHAAFSYTPRVKAVAAVAAILLFLQGGGVFSFMLRSDDVWYWQQSAIQQANHIAQRIVSLIMIAGSRYF